MGKKIRWGLIGCGQMGHLFANSITLVEDAELVVACSLHTHSLNKFISAFPSVKPVNEVGAILSDSSIDVIYIATPPNTHKELTLKSLNSGKSVVCEKPFATSFSDAEEMVQTARNLGLFCMEAMWMRFNPLIIKIKSIITSGQLGEIRLITANLGHCLDPGAAQVRGGVVLDLGVYLCSFANLISGKPENVSSETSGETTSILLRYANDSLAVLTATLESSIQNQCMIVGTKQNLIIRGPIYRPYNALLSINEPVKINAHSTLLPFKYFQYFKDFFRSFLPEKGTCLRVPYVGHGYHYEIVEAMKCIQNHETESNIMPLEDSLAVMKIIDQVIDKGKGAQC